MPITLNARRITSPDIVTPHNSVACDGDQAYGGQVPPMPARTTTAPQA